MISRIYDLLWPYRYVFGLILFCGGFAIIESGIAPWLIVLQLAPLSWKGRGYGFADDDGCE